MRFEQIRAFRDTWELGIHSYLTYLRDRLLHTARARWDHVDLEVPYARGDVISAVYASGRDVTQEAGPESTIIRALMPPVDAARTAVAARRER